MAVKTSMSLVMISVTPPTSRFMMQKQVVNQIQNYLEKRKLVENKELGFPHTVNPSIASSAKTNPSYRCNKRRR